MIPLALTITDWGPFLGSQVFRFPQAPGLYFLWGRNEAEPRLGANGAGKSRLFEALCWCFFEKTSRGLRAGNVASWSVQKKARVDFDFQVETGRYRVSRQWSPNLWTLVNLDTEELWDLAKDSSNKLAGFLGLPYETYTQTIFMPQRRPMFLDLKPEAQAGLFSALMGLDRWLERSQKASARALVLDREARLLEQEVAKLSGRLEEFDRADLTSEYQLWKADQKRRRDQIAQDFEDTINAKKQKKGQLYGAKKEREQAEGRLQEAEQALDEFRDRSAIGFHELEEAINQCRDDIAYWVSTGHQASARIQRLQNAEGACPTCGASMSKEHRDKEILLEDKALRKAQSERKKLEILKGDLELDMAKMQSDLDELVEQRDRQRASLRMAEAAWSDISKAMDKDEELLVRLEKALDALESEEGPDPGKRERLRNKLLADHRRATRQLDDLLGQTKTLEMWARWFKELRLEQIGQALAQMEIEVNNQLSVFGLPGWGLQFSVDKESSSGAVSRGFNVLVVSPQQARPVPWEVWSGGEAQRLRLAAQCGLINLSRAQTGATLSLEVWDEPTDGMSAQGISDLLTGLRERALTEQRPIWIIDHHALSFGGFAGMAGVIKTSAGSRFEVNGLYMEDTYQSPQDASDIQNAMRDQGHDGLPIRARRRTT